MTIPRSLKGYGFVPNPPIGDKEIEKMAAGALRL